MIKRLLLCLYIALFCGLCGVAQVQPQQPPVGNINGNLFANGYGGWSVPMGNAGPWSWTSPVSCTVNRGGTTFAAFTVGTPINLYDQIDATQNETVTVTGVQTSTESCSISTTTPQFQHTQFSLGSATAGLQEAINANLNTKVPLTVHLTADWYQLGGTTSMVTATAQGNTSIGIVDETQTPSNWYSWQTSHYVLVPVGTGGALTLTTNNTSGPATLNQTTHTLNVPNYTPGSAGQLGTRQGDAVANNGDNTAPVDQDLYYAQLPNTQAGNNGLTVQQAITAANTHNGATVILPGVGRTPFTNPGAQRALDLRSDIPATARSVKEDGAVCDTEVVYGTLVAGSNTVTLINTARGAADVGKSIIAVGVTGGGLVTQFESAITGVPDSLHLTITTNSPFTQSINHAINLGHDDTASINKTMNTVGGGGTFVIPAGTCQSHTLTLRGQSPVGLGIQSQMVQMPGEDLFAAPDPSQTQGVNQGAAHIHDIQFLFDSRIDARQPWQKCNDSGCTAQTALYRPGAALSAVAANPLAPGWMVGAFNGVASITSGSAVMCVPNSETKPAVGQTVIFPYQATIYTSTVASTAGSCSAGFTARTLNANLGITSAQAEWFAGSSVQNLSVSIGSGACPSTITLANNIDPVPGYESNVPPFGLIQIDGEQFTYFGKTNAGNHSPLNTFYGIQCAQNGTSRAAHSSAATVFPLNRIKPAYPWPVIPSINANDTTPSATATYYPGWNAGNAVFAFPVVSGATPIGSGGWSANAHIEDLSFFAFPNEINGESWQEVNGTTLMYFVTPHYAATFSNWYGLYSSFGIFNGPPSLMNHAYATAQPTGDGTHWEAMQIYATNPMIMAAGNQNSFSDFNVYSQEGQVTGGSLGANTCWYMVANHDDQNGSYFTAMTLGHFKNIYCEPEGGAHAASMPQWEWDSYNSEIEDQHMGGGGEVYIGGAQQHWFGGNFNNAISTPVVAFGSQNSAMRVTNLGSEPKGNTYSVNSLINYGYGNDFSGTTAQAFSSPSGPWGGMQVGGRNAIPNQNADTFLTGNLTAPFTSLEGGLVTPEEFNASFQFESQAMSVGYTFDDTAPVTHSYTACNVGNNPGSTYCFTSAFNQERIGVGVGQRIAPGKYILWISAKDVTAATNTWQLSVGTTCNGIIGTYNIPLKNTWPATIGDYFQVPIDFTGNTATNCGLGLVINGATTADQVRISFMAFSPVQEEINAQTINVTTINVPGGSTGGTATGCQQSPVTGIKNGYTCPTKGTQTTLTANQGSGDATATVNSTSTFSAAGCFFVDGEYECYTSIIDGTHLGGISRGAYLTTAAAHTSGAGVVAVTLVLGSVQQSPSTVIAYGGSEGQIFSVNNGFPFNHGGSNIFSINGGGNEVWWNTDGSMTQQNPGSFSNFHGTLIVGNLFPFHPFLADTGFLLQSNVPGTSLQPQSLAGGHAGSLNVIQPPTIAAPNLQGALPSGASTASWVCSGLDVDGNAIPGTTRTVTSVAATWSFPQGVSVGCPWSAGVVTYKIWRTAGGVDQGLLGTGTGLGNGYWISDFGGASSGGTPPVSNTSNPHISVAGSGNPTIAMGTASWVVAAGAPSGACVTASLYTRTDGGASTTLYVCESGAWVAK